jgi:hypothetical protein
MNRLLKTLLLTGAATLICAGAHAGPRINTGKITPSPIRSTHNTIQRLMLPARPDLAVSLGISNVHRNSDGSYDFDLVAQVLNVGTGKYLTAANQQSLGVFENVGHHNLRQASFGNLNPGQRFSTTQRIRHYWKSTEFFTGYRSEIAFDPDIRIDNNSANDDSNPRNNSASLSQEQVNRMLGG